MPTASRTLLFILIVALGLRLAAVFAQDQRLGYENGGGDATWYLAAGYALASGFDEGYLPGYGVDLYPEGFPVSLRHLPTPPLYLLFVGVPQTLLPREAAVIAARVLQALMSAATCYCAYRLGRALADDDRAGLIAAGVLAISPAFILESAQIYTETLYIFLVTAALTLYVEHVGTLRWLALAGVLLGLATLTRAVLLLFPLGLAIHLVMVGGLRDGLKRAALLLVVYALVVGSWTAYNLIRWNRWVIGGEGFAAFLYLGATDQGWQGAATTDAALAAGGNLPPDPGDQQQVYLENAQSLIGSDPLGYLGRRVRQLAEAYAQPHGTLLFSGASVRDLLAGWLHENRTLSGLVDLAGTPGFWPKLALYVFHYAGLVAGLIGVWWMRRRRRVALPLLGFIVYTSLIHLFLEAIPRYIFPTMVFWWVFAGAGIAAIRQVRRRASASAPQTAQADSLAH